MHADGCWKTPPQKARRPSDHDNAKPATNPIHVVVVVVVARARVYPRPLDEIQKFARAVVIIIAVSVVVYCSSLYACRRDRDNARTPLPFVIVHGGRDKQHGGRGRARTDGAGTTAIVVPVRVDWTRVKTRFSSAAMRS